MMIFCLYSTKRRQLTRLPLSLPLHQHNIRSHLYIVLVFVRVVHIVYYSVYGYLRLFLLYFCIKNARIGRQTGCGRLVVNRLIISEIEIYYLGVIMVITFSASVSRFKSRSIPTGLATLPSGS
jgi:hypothetical protein